jgi:hypothetical protein
MATTRIKSDCYSVFVRTSSNLYRPVPCRYASDPEPDVSVVEFGGTKFGLDEVVKVKLVKNPDWCSVKAFDDTEEYWYLHGPYIGPDGLWLQSDQVWNPRRTKL